MKKIVVTLLLLPLLGFAQSIENIDYISPFHDGVAAIKKAEKWAFINQEAQIVVDFRDDLVLTKIDDTSYPIFNSERCLITDQKDGVLYYGYIDKTGKTVIKPQFLHTTNFVEGKALALKVEKEIIGYNQIFKKDVLGYNYFEIVIDFDGNVNEYLTQLAIHSAPSEKGVKTPLEITSKLISSNLVAIKNIDKTWTLKNIN